MSKILWISLVLFWGFMILPMMAGPVVVIDPGHGGSGCWKYGCGSGDPGIVGQGDLTEQWVNMIVAKEVHAMFPLNIWPGSSAFLTRDHDTLRPTLADRVQRAEELDARYFLSIHHNASVSGNVLWAADVSSAPTGTIDSVPYRSATKGGVCLAFRKLAVDK